MADVRRQQRQARRAILQDIAMEFSLHSVLDTWMDAIRAFYTSSMDALLLGHVLIQKSGIQ